MRSTKNKFIPVILAILFAASAAFAQDAVSSVPASDLKSIEVSKFDVHEDVKFPDSALDVMTSEIVDELVKLKRFDKVTSSASAVPHTGTTLLLTGTVTKFQPGSRATRYLVGFGAGKTKIVAAIKIVNKDTGAVVLEKSVDGKVIMGMFGGDSNGATRGLAKEVASDIKKAVFK